MNKLYRLTRIVYVFAFTVALAVSVFIYIPTPSNDRQWAKDQDTLPHITFTDNIVTIEHIRNFIYESTATYTPQYYSKSFNIDELKSVDYIVEPFGNVGAAHTFLSFGFNDDSYLAVSVEIRKEIGESFSPWKGLMRQYELMYVIADERDVIALRTNHRKDDVYLYPVTTSLENIRTLFKNILTSAADLELNPQFYNTLTNNCTTNIAEHINIITPNRISWDYRLLFPENSDVLAQELGLIAQGMTIEEAREKYRINEKAMLFEGDPLFSQKIRE